jgi:hypothetical protein
MILRSLALFSILLFAVGCAPTDEAGDGATGVGDEGTNTTSAPALDDAQLVCVDLVRTA